MSLLDAQPSKASMVERITLPGLLAAFLIGTAVSILLEIGWAALGFAFFTTKESDVPWYYPVSMLITAILVISAGGLIATCIAVFIQQFHRE